MIATLLAQTADVIGGAITSVDVQAIAPEMILTGALLIVLVVDLFLPDEWKAANAVISIAGIGGAAIALVTLVGDRRETFAGMFVVDNYAVLFKFLFLAVGAVIVLLSITYLNETVRRTQGEFYFLLLCAILGALAMPSSRDMLALFVALELVSVPGFVLAGFRKGDERGNEAAVKFFLFGVLSSAVMLFGMSLIYGVTGSTNLTTIAQKLAGRPDDPLVTASILLIVVGFAFKVSAVPFHFWAPDTYEGSPVPVAAFLSVASKAAGFAGLLSLLFVGFPDHTNAWAPGFAILAAVTMTIGNVVALSQTHLVRLLAYSSIAQSGYMLLPLGIVAGQSAEVQQAAFASSLTYILIYSFMNLGAFAVAVVVGRRHPANRITDYEGLSQREPGLALAMLVFLLSLGGIIPTAGFWAKFFVFRAALGAEGSGSVLLAALMVINTVIGLYYYLSVGTRMYLREPADRSPVGVPYTVAVAIALLALVVAAVTIYPDLFNDLSPRSTLVAF